MPLVLAIGQIDALDNCCGVKELGELNSYSNPSEKAASNIFNSWGGSYTTTRLLFVKEDGDRYANVEAFLRKLMADHPAAFYQVWFVAEGEYDDGDDEDESPNSWGDYECNELREIVQQFPNVVHLGEAINPNTGNKIDGYLWAAF